METETTNQNGGSPSPSAAGSETPVERRPVRSEAEYVIWRFHAWADNQGSYIEIEDKVARGELVPELPYKSPNASSSSTDGKRTTK